MILDVVYNHFGPDGNYIREFAPQFLSTIHKTEWGDPFNFDGPDSGPVREFFIANAAYWIDEYHIDGLRLDATQAIFDDSPNHIVAELTDRARAAAKERSDLRHGRERVAGRQLRSGRGRRAGAGWTRVWNDDLHHAARVALTGKNEGYFTDYSGNPQEFVSAAKWGFLYQGQQYRWHNRRRGRPAFDIAAHRFVAFLENHDQIANSGRGYRVNQMTSPSRFRAMTAYLLLIPATPMLFQGQEYASTSPFLYFADHSPDLSALVFKGRREAMQRFRSQSSPEGMALVPDPSDPQTFERSKLDYAERASRPEWLRPAPRSDSRCGRPTRRSAARPRRISTARYSARRRSCCGSSCPTTATAS